MPKLIFTSRYLKDVPASRLENYVDYIANRPQVERIGDHGLFTDAGSAVVLSQVQREAAEHPGNPGSGFCIQLQP